MKVKAVEMGYYGDVRVKPGTVFELPDHIALAQKDKTGKSVLPRWVVPAGQPIKEKGLKLPGTRVATTRRGQPSSYHESKSKNENAFSSIVTGDSEVI